MKDLIIRMLQYDEDFRIGWEEIFNNALVINQHQY